MTRTGGVVAGHMSAVWRERTVGKMLLFRAALPDSLRSPDAGVQSQERALTLRRWCHLIRPQRSTDLEAGAGVWPGGLSTGLGFQPADRPMGHRHQCCLEGSLGTLGNLHLARRARKVSVEF